MHTSTLPSSPDERSVTPMFSSSQTETHHLRPHRRARLMRLRAMLSEDALSLSQHTLSDQEKDHQETPVLPAPSLVQYDQRDVGVRLHSEAKRQAAFLQQARSRIEEERRSELTFRPDVSRSRSSFTTSDPLEYKPIYERVASLQRDRSARLQQLKEMLERDRESEFTFQPLIDEKSKRIVEKMNQEELFSSKVKDTGSRLFNDGRLIAYKKELLALEHAKRKEAEFTQPRLCEGTEQIARESPLLSAEFEDRLRMYEVKQTFHRNQLQSAKQRESRDWFRPYIQESSRKIIQKALPEMLEEDGEERLERWGRQAVLQKELNVRRIANEMYAECSFSPWIDPISRELGREPSLLELHTNHRGLRRKEALQRKLENQIMAECTFQPAINSRYPSKELSPKSNESPTSVDCPVLNAYDSFDPKIDRRPPYDRTNFYLHCPELVMQRITEHKRRREEMRDNEQRLRMTREMQECTFEPKVKPYQKEENSSPVVIRGLDRFLEHREQCVRLKEYRARREREVFELDMSSFREPGSNTTIVEVCLLLIILIFNTYSSPSVSMSPAADLVVLSEE